jgi:hypothetical protein
LQLMVALLCNLVQDEGGKGGNNRLGPNSTAVLIFVVFGSTLAFFGMTVQATVRGSLKTKGVVGKLANGMARCCCIVPKKDNSGHHAEDRPPSLARVVPVQQDGQEQQQKARLKKEIAALKWQKKIRQTLMNNNKPLTTTGIPNRLKSKQTWRTQRAEEIQNAHQNHRVLALKNIEQQHSQRRSSLQLRVEARKKKKEGEEKVTESVALRGNETEMEVEKVLEKEDGKKQMAAPDGLDNSVERTLSNNIARTAIKTEEHVTTHAPKTLESEKLLKSVKLQQQIHRIKEVQASTGRLKEKRLAKGI